MSIQTEMLEELQLRERGILARESTPTEAEKGIEQLGFELQFGSLLRIPAIAASLCAIKDRDADADTEYYCTPPRTPATDLAAPTKLQFATLAFTRCS